jgi:hypothetical protein
MLVGIMVIFVLALLAEAVSGAEYLPVKGKIKHLGGLRETR